MHLLHLLIPLLHQMQGAQEKAAAAAAADQGTSHDAIRRSICCTSELYAAAKNAAASWMRALSDELASSGLLVTLLGELAMMEEVQSSNRSANAHKRFRVLTVTPGIWAYFSRPTGVSGHYQGRHSVAEGPPNTTEGRQGFLPACKVL